MCSALRRAISSYSRVVQLEKKCCSSALRPEGMICGAPPPACMANGSPYAPLWSMRGTGCQLIATRHNGYNLRHACNLSSCRRRLAPHTPSRTGQPLRREPRYSARLLAPLPAGAAQQAPAPRAGPRLTLTLRPNGESRNTIETRRFLHRSRARFTILMDADGDALVAGARVPQLSAGEEVKYIKNHVAVFLDDR